jgi:hypothetical protein
MGVVEAGGFRQVADAGEFSGGFFSFPKLAQRFGNARLGETPSPFRRTTTSIAVPMRSRPPPKRSFVSRVRSQSAALTLGTRGKMDESGWGYGERAGTRVVVSPAFAHMHGLAPFSHFLLSLPCETAFRAQGRSQAEFRNEEPKRVSF